MALANWFAENDPPFYQRALNQLGPANVGLAVGGHFANRLVQRAADQALNLGQRGLDYVLPEYRARAINEYINPRLRAPAQNDFVAPAGQPYQGNAVGNFHYNNRGQYQRGRFNPQRQRFAQDRYAARRSRQSMSAPKRTKAFANAGPSSYASLSSSAPPSPSPPWRWCFCLDHHPFHSSQCLALLALLDPSLADSVNEDNREVTQECLDMPPESERMEDEPPPIPNLLDLLEDQLENLASLLSAEPSLNEDGSQAYPTQHDSA